MGFRAVAVSAVRYVEGASLHLFWMAMGVTPCHLSRVGTITLDGVEVAHLDVVEPQQIEVLFHRLHAMCYHMSRIGADGCVNIHDWVTACGQQMTARSGTKWSTGERQQNERTTCARRENPPFQPLWNLRLCSGSGIHLF